MLAAIRSEAAFITGAVTTALFFVFGDAWMADLGNAAKTAGLALWIFTVMLWCAFGVVRHADHLAEILGEPYGTLILTLSVISIEVALIAAIMLTGESNPQLARDTMLAVIMIVLNGMVGLALLAGGLRHGEQEFNLQGARAFLVVIVVLATMSLVLPKFTVSTVDASLTRLQAGIFAAMTIVLYGTFLAIQTVRHRKFFVEPADADGKPDGASLHDGSGNTLRAVAYHAVFLVLTLLPIVLLSKKFAVLVEYSLERLSAPAALGGILVAVLVLAPEGLAAYHAALANHLQRSVNICLGSALATISLTVPAVLVVGSLTGLHIVLGLDDVEMVLLLLTLFLSSMTFGGVRTNMLQGAVHLVVFLVYIVLIFNP